MSDFLNYSVMDLLDATAAGPYVPGAGTTAALSGAMAASLLLAASEASRRALGKEACILTEAQIDEFQTAVRSYRSELISAAQLDANTFGRFGAVRTARNKYPAKTSLWKELDRQSNELLRESASALSLIYKSAVSLAERAVFLCRCTVWWVGGDCHVAANLALAATDGALATMRLNTFTLREHNQDWCRMMMEDVNAVATEVVRLRGDLAQLPQRAYAPNASHRVAIDGSKVTPDLEERLRGSCAAGDAPGAEAVLQ